jgi:hypothetical protein
MLVISEHLLELSFLFRIQNLRNAAVSVGEHIVVVMRKVIEDRRQLDGLLIGQIKLLFPFRHGHGEARRHWRCSVQTGMAADTHDHRTEYGSAEKNKQKRNNRNFFGGAGKSSGGHPGCHILPVSSVASRRLNENYS